MQETLIEIVNNYGYIGIALLICIENVFPPIPSEVVLVFGGFITIHTEMNVWLVILFATIGSTAGAAILYLLGRIIRKDVLKKLFAGKFGKVMHVRANDLEKAEKWFMRYEYKAVFICRCVPVVRSLISIPAGMAKMKPLPFFTLTILGSAIWNTVLVWIGSLTGDAWESSLKYIGWYSKAAIAVLLIVAVIIIFILFKKRKKARNIGKTEDGE